MPTTPDEGQAQASVTISAVISQSQRDALVTIGGGNLSAGLRLLLSSPRSTPSGSGWVEHVDLLPAAADHSGPWVVALPAAIVAHGATADALVVDAELGRLCFAGAIDPGARTELALGDLAALAGRFLPALLACLDARPEVDQFGHDLPCGLHLSRVAPGLLQLAPRGNTGRPSPTVLLPVRHALQLAAELTSLLARQVAAHQVAVVRLDRQLQEAA